MKNKPHLQCIVTLLILAFNLPYSFAQSNFEGAWFYLGENSRSSLICEINGEGLTHYTWDEDSEKYVTFRSSRGNGSQFVDHYQENKNNATYYWINTCDGCGWTETQNYHIFHVSPHVKYVKFERLVNNIGTGNDSGVDQCWDEEGQCFTVSDEGYMRRFPTQILEVKSIGALSQPYFKPIELRQTGITTELTVNLSISQQDIQGTLNAPGSSDAFYLRDNNGTKYKIVDQLGFGGFVTKTLRKGDEIELVLIFEKMPENITSFSLIEGDCSEGCWHAYDIKVE